MENFLDGSLIKDARTIKEVTFFEKKGIYTPTFKGLRVLEDFIQTCHLQSEAEHLNTILRAQSSTRPEIFHINRMSAPENDLILTNAVITQLFQCMMGPSPKCGAAPETARDNNSGQLVPKDRASKLLKDALKRNEPHLRGKISSDTSMTTCIQAIKIINWLCDYTVVTSSQEAGRIAAHFVRLGFIVLLHVVATDNITTFSISGLVPRGSSITVSSHLPF